MSHPGPSYGVAYPEQSHAEAALIAALIGGVLATVGWCCWPIAIVGLVVVSAAGVLGHIEVQAIDNGKRDPAKRKTANIARITAIACVVLVVAVFILLVVAILVDQGGFGQ